MKPLEAEILLSEMKEWNVDEVKELSRKMNLKISDEQAGEALQLAKSYSRDGLAKSYSRDGLVNYYVLQSSIMQILACGE